MRASGKCSGNAGRKARSSGACDHSKKMCEVRGVMETQLVSFDTLILFKLVM